MRLIHLVILTAIVLGYTNCSQFDFTSRTATSTAEGGGSEVGNPMAPVSVLAYTPPTSGFALRFCLKEIKMIDNLLITTFFVGPLVIDANASGFSLPSVPVPDGHYNAVVLRFTDECLPATQSIELTNASGSFADTATIVDLTFAGDVTLSGTNRRFDLNMQPIIDELGSVTSNAEVIPRATARMGTF